jgi:PAS domain-containing protein
VGDRRRTLKRCNAPTRTITAHGGTSADPRLDDRRSGDTASVADQHPVEIILARGLMSNLTTPAFLVDLEGTLVFYNEAAGDLLGLHFEEAGPMPVDEWGTFFVPHDETGAPIPVPELPLSRVLSNGQPSHRQMWVRSTLGENRGLEVSAFPIVGSGGMRGALAIFWELPVTP